MQELTKAQVEMLETDEIKRIREALLRELIPQAQSQLVALQRSLVVADREYGRRKSRNYLTGIKI